MFPSSFTHLLQKLEAFTHGPVVIEPKVGGSFALFGGNVSGVISGLVRSGFISIGLLSNFQFFFFFFFFFFFKFFEIYLEFAFNYFSISFLTFCKLLKLLQSFASSLFILARTTQEVNESLHMKWRFKSWPSDHFSDVTLLFRQKDNCTTVSLKQTGIPGSSNSQLTIFF